MSDDKHGFGWGMFIGLFVVFLVTLSFYAPQRATISLLVMEDVKIVDQSDAIYLQPAWGIGMNNLGLNINSIQHSICIKGRMPDFEQTLSQALPGRHIYTLIKGHGSDEASTFAWDLWLVYYVPLSLLFSFLITFSIYRKRSRIECKVE